MAIFRAPPTTSTRSPTPRGSCHERCGTARGGGLFVDGLRLLFETIQGLEQDLSHQLENIFIVVNAFNQTFKIAREALEALKAHYSEYLLGSVVRQCTKFAQASSEGCPIFTFDPESKGAVDLEALLDEVLSRIGAAEPRVDAAGA